MLRFMLLALVAALSALAAAPEFVPLFPKGAPGIKHATGPEKDTTTPQDNLIMGRPVIRTGDVSEPSIAFYPAPAAHNSGATVIVFPGGGYRILALDLEGTEVCDWLNSIGINAVLVKYRVPQPDTALRYKEPLQDAQRAVSYVRSKAEEWRIDALKIGVLGFSAGAHLAVMVSNSFDKKTYEPQDKADDLNSRPDFTIIVYPAYLAAGSKLNLLAPEIHIPFDAPPCLLIQAEDDPVHVENSLLYYQALKEAKIPAEMHLFSNGGHGYGLRPDPDKPVTGWPKLVEDWMKARHILTSVP